MAGLKIYDSITATAQTTGGATTAILTSAPPNSVNTIAIVQVLARCMTTGDRAYWYRAVFFNKDAAGVMTIDSQTDITPQFSTNPIKKADIAFDLTGGVVSLNVTGDPGFVTNPLEWQALIVFWRT